MNTKVVLFVQNALIVVLLRIVQNYFYGHYRNSK